MNEPTLTLDQVRDRMNDVQLCCREQFVQVSHVEFRQWRGAIDAEIRRRGEAVGVVTAISVNGYPMRDSTGVEWLMPIPAGTKLYASAPPATRVDDAMVERGCRGICAHHGWNADEPVTYAGTRRKAKDPDGSFVPQWKMHEPDARAALTAALGESK